MANSRWGRIDGVLRSVHLYTGLFLAPWFLVYATSGFCLNHFANVAWAALVDVVTISMWVWVLSGFYIWLRQPRRRLIGTLVAVGGSILFIILTILLCR